MEDGLTPIEAASYCAYNFSYNMYNDMLLFMTLNMISSIQGMNALEASLLSEDDISDKLYEQILISSESKTVGIA